MDKADAIITADWHLRDTLPKCRTDTFIEGVWFAQAKKLRTIFNLAILHDCPILLAGDLFHKAKSSQFLEQAVIRQIPNEVEIITVAGNHDLPNNTLKNYHQSSLAVLEAAGKISLSAKRVDLNIPTGHCVFRFHWTEKPENQIDRIERKIALCHYFVYKNKPHWAEDGEKAIDLLKRLDYDLIITGHNHSSFVVEHDGKILVNPGSMTRQTADQFKHQSKVYLWYAEKNKIVPIDLGCEDADKVMTREHLEVAEKRNGRLDAFVERLDEGYEVGLSFEDNRKKYFKKNRTKKAVREIVEEITNVE